jgi:hypothetical protein
MTFLQTTGKHSCSALSMLPHRREASRSRSRSRSRSGHIGRRDLDAHRRSASTTGGSRASSPDGLLRDDGSLAGNVVDGIVGRDGRKMERQVAKCASFASAVLSW